MEFSIAPSSASFTFSSSMGNLESEAEISIRGEITAFTEAINGVIESARVLSSVERAAIINQYIGIHDRLVQIWYSSSLSVKLKLEQHMRSISCSFSLLIQSQIPKMESESERREYIRTEVYTDYKSVNLFYDTAFSLRLDAAYKLFQFYRHHQDDVNSIRAIDIVRKALAGPGCIENPSDRTKEMINMAKATIEYWKKGIQANIGEEVDAEAEQNASEGGEVEVKVKGEN